MINMFYQLPPRKKVGLLAAVASTVLMDGAILLTMIIPGAGEKDSIIGAILYVFFVIGFVAMVVAYALGGLIEALKMAISIGKWGWLFLPFPIDLVTGLGASIAALLIILIFPLLPVYRNCKKYIEVHGEYTPTDDEFQMPSLGQIKDRLMKQDDSGSDEQPLEKTETPKKKVGSASLPKSVEKPVQKPVPKSTQNPANKPVQKKPVSKSGNSAFRTGVQSYFAQCKSLEELNRKYKELAVKLQGGKEEAIPIVKEEYKKKKSALGMSS